MAHEILKRTDVFKGRIVHLVVDEVVLPDGSAAVREIVLHEDAAAVLPVDEDGMIFLVKQYRHAIGREALEIPAGLLDEGEQPHECAARELEEEIGYRAASLLAVCSFHNAIGFCNEMCHLFIAQNLTKTVQSPDADEFLTVEKYSLEQCEEMIRQGEITDSKTIIAVLAYRQLISIIDN